MDVNCQQEQVSHYLLHKESFDMTVNIIFIMGQKTKTKILIISRLSKTRIKARKTNLGHQNFLFIKTPPPRNLLDIQKPVLKTL